MLNDNPRAIPGSKVAITDTITLSMRIDRTWVVELGKHVVIIFSAEETSEVYSYLVKHMAKFTKSE